MLHKLFRSEFIPNPNNISGDMIYYDDYIEINNHFNYIIENYKKIKLGKNLVQKGHGRYWNEISWNIMTTKFNKTIHLTKNGKLEIVELNRGQLGYVFDNITYNGIEYRFKF